MAENKLDFPQVTHNRVQGEEKDAEQVNYYDLFVIIFHLFRLYLEKATNADDGKVNGHGSTSLDMVKGNPNIIFFITYVVYLRLVLASDTVDGLKLVQAFRDTKKSDDDHNGGPVILVTVLDEENIIFQGEDTSTNLVKILGRVGDASRFKIGLMGWCLPPPPVFWEDFFHKTNKICPKGGLNPWTNQGLGRTTFPFLETFLWHNSHVKNAGIYFWKNLA